MSGSAIEVRNLSKKFGKFTAVDDVSFDVREGEIFGSSGERRGEVDNNTDALRTPLPPAGGPPVSQGVTYGRSLKK